MLLFSDQQNLDIPDEESYSTQYKFIYYLAYTR